MKRTGKRCCEPNCLVERYSLGRCLAHFRTMDPAEATRLRNLTRAEREAEFDSMRIHPPTPKWEYENPAGEAELTAMFDKQEKETPEAN
jgi:hypothetical protein